MTASTLTRPQRAMQLERRTFRQWTPARIGILIPSQSRPGLMHNATLDGCDCEDFRYRVGTPNGPTACQHMLAARIFLGRHA